MNFRPRAIASNVPIEADYGSNSLIDLALKNMAGRLNLASLVTPLYGANDPALRVDLPEFFKNRVFHCPADNLHPGRSGKRVHHVLEHSTFLKKDRLCMRRIP